MPSVRVVRVAPVPRMRLAWLQWLLSIFIVAVLLQGVLAVAQGGADASPLAAWGAAAAWVAAVLQVLAALLLAAGLVWARLWLHVAGAAMAVLPLAAVLVLQPAVAPGLAAIAAVAVLALRRDEIRAAMRK